MSDLPALTATPTEPVPVPGGAASTHRLLWVILALVLVLVAGGAVTAVMLSSANTGPVAATLTASPPTTASPSPSATAPTLPSVQGVPVLAMPKTLLGRALSTGGYKATAQSMLKDYTFNPPALREVGAAYGSTAKKTQVIALAYAITLNNPAGFLTESGFPLTGAERVDAGPAGGAAVCGTAKNFSPKSAYCMWADENSLGILVFVGTTPAKAAPLLVTARAEIQIQS
ncbi:hypothetical protein F4553_001597 [Allocatelliglobosispora scoriae]|uniref:Uncharacterized protein n=1 Tax=Allocatelliglobosispora scoriae TaxID=643052 RepID=A0A841BLH8_9ACTN|nr:hypothetical protein [Allocatelliglobosispora scoriae]MBB5868218.1 hypothetical protein [Allocatelliglobosispora scoriae]